MNLNFVCVNAGNYCGNGRAYVETLFDMVRRNLSSGTEGKFIVYTDDEDEYAQGIEKRQLYKGLKGWWNKLYLFSRGEFSDNDRVIYLDLDTIIIGGIDCLLDFQGTFAILRDFYRKDGLQSSVMMWRGNALSDIWDKFKKQGFPNIDGGDQAFIEQNLPVKPHILQHIWPDVFKSYKQSCIGGIPKDCKIVVFHGFPRPHEAGGWVDKIWKIGGGSVIDLEMVCNVEADKLESNIRQNIQGNVNCISKMGDKKDVPACIVGGGASLIKDINQIRLFHQFGYKIFALNGAAKYLRERYINPDYIIIADARPDNVEFIPHDFEGEVLIASHCDPILLKFCRDNDIRFTLWHRGHDGIDSIVNPDGDKYVAYFSGGSTVGMVGISLVYGHGYNDIHLFGYDSSYDGDNGHAYAQKLNDGERVLEADINGKIFKAAPWMIQQLNEFNELAPIMIELGCTLNVHGEGMLPYLAKQMSDAALPEDEFIEHNGLLWPKHDIECRASIDAFHEDCDEYVSLCEQKRVVVQAGGNVGVWAKKLAKEFEVVYTFEPDYANFHCLCHNVVEKNVIKLQAALGQYHELIGLTTNRMNCGAHSVNKEGFYPTLRIDDLALHNCDLIILDIEGFEIFALRGAERTIREFRPVIVCEEKSLGDKYGIDDSEISRFLSVLGYKKALKKNRDIVYLPITGG